MILHRYRAKHNGSLLLASKISLPLCIRVRRALLLPSVALKLYLTPFLTHFENPRDNGCNDKASKTCCYCLGFFFMPPFISVSLSTCVLSVLCFFFCFCFFENDASAVGRCICYSHFYHKKKLVSFIYLQ